MASSLRAVLSWRRRYFRIPAASSIISRRSAEEACKILSSCPCPISTCISRPIPASARISCTSARRAGDPLISYSLPPARNIVREISTVSAGIDSAPSVLSRRKTTWARPNWDFPPFSAPLVPEPAKITSCMEPPRRVFAPCSPITQASASIILDFPEPLGPTTALMPGANSNVVDDAKDLKPRRVSEVRCTDCLSSGGNRAGVLAGAE